jgi:hypothetical protein
MEMNKDPEIEIALGEGRLLRRRYFPEMEIQ